MQNPVPISRSAVRSAFTDPVVWGRTLRIGLPVGLLQVAINQGDTWLSGVITTAVVLKSILSPTVSCAIAFTAASSARRASLR